MSTLNPTAFSIFADNPADYASGDGEDLRDLIDEDSYNGNELGAADRDAGQKLGREDAASEDGRADENDYSHGEGDPDAVGPTRAPVASEELEEFERGDPT